jgi:segregation and condensation protein A
MPPEDRGEVAEPAGAGAFQVHLDNFTGPFDLLLSLISRHRLDITEVALAQVTDEFIAAVRDAEARAQPWELGHLSEFLVVAATLLDLKAARLLPATDNEDAEDLEWLEARDLLFARLLQYRAFKEVAAGIGARLSDQARCIPRSVTLEPHLASLLPELVLKIGPAELAVLAAFAMRSKPQPTVDLHHLHQPAVSVREQAGVLMERLRLSGSGSFRSLVADAGSTGVVVARFLALLELFREGAIAFDQVSPLGDLTIRWTGGDAEVTVQDDYEGRSSGDGEHEVPAGDGDAVALRGAVGGEGSGA